MISREDLQTIPTFNGLAPETLDWMILKGEERILEKGEKIFVKGEEAELMFSVLSGNIVIMADPEGQGNLRPIFTIHQGDVSGILPFSRMTTAAGDGVATEQSRFHVLHKDHFLEMEREYPDLVQRLVSLMTDRARSGARDQQNREKLMALGKLSAGLAHELNNPAAAIKRTADELQETLLQLPKKVSQLIPEGPNQDKFLLIVDLMDSKKADGNMLEMSLKERSQREEELEDWLDDHDIGDADILAETFFEMGINENDLDELAESIGEDQLSDMLKWAEASLSSKRLANEISAASARISELVQSIKSYSHMDRAKALEATDLREGLKSTLTMLGHKLKTKGVEAKVDFPKDLPKANALPGEINQVWTNLLDNAIDASPEKNGQIRIEAHERGKFVQVSIIDNGSGIPEDIQTKIFQPFFTTKKQGNGTGLGLDLTRRIITNHNGDIWVDSKPGRTEFVVCLPKA